MQLATIVGRVMEQHEDAEVVIISKDQDYQAVIDYWTKHGRKISMAQSIEQYLNPQKKAANTSTVQKAQSNTQTPTINETKSPDIEAYRQKVAEILKELFPSKSKASITKYSKSIAAKKEKKVLKDYCISAFADNKNNYRVYSRICKEFPY